MLNKKIEWVNELKWAKKPKKLPVVFTEEEITDILTMLNGVYWLVANIMYGSGFLVDPIYFSLFSPILMN